MPSPIGDFADQVGQGGGQGTSVFHHGGRSHRGNQAQPLLLRPRTEYIVGSSSPKGRPAMEVTGKPWDSTLEWHLHWQWDDLEYSACNRDADGSRERNKTRSEQSNATTSSLGALPAPASLVASHRIDQRDHVPYHSFPPPGISGDDPGLTADGPHRKVSAAAVSPGTQNRLGEDLSLWTGVCVCVCPEPRDSYPAVRRRICLDTGDGACVVARTPRTTLTAG
jgi:hypothetical protein